MKILTAILGEIEPYSFSDAAIEKSLADACLRLECEQLSVEDDYDAETKRPVAVACMLLLVKAISLSSESISGGVSQSYATAEIKGRIRSIAQANDLSPFLVLSDDNEPTIQHMNVW
jgi:hypothetical protein